MEELQSGGREEGAEKMNPESSLNKQGAVCSCV